MSLWKVSAAVLLLAIGCLADTPQIDSEAVRRVGRHIACKCGSCKETTICPMSMQGCGFCVPSKNKIARMQQAGFSDQAIIDSFIKQYGPDIYRAGPSSYFWLVPYGALILGATAIFWFVSRFSRRSAAAGGPGVPVPDDAVYARYREAIEKESGRINS
jgi:cytochrome c-type biogenesis protein CcmH/NrfF